MKSPCMNCDNRHEKCHVTCQLYLHYRKKVEKENIEIQKEKSVYQIHAHSYTGMPRKDISTRI